MCPNSGFFNFILYLCTRYNMRALARVYIIRYMIDTSVFQNKTAKYVTVALLKWPTTNAVRRYTNL